MSLNPTERALGEELAELLCNMLDAHTDYAQTENDDPCLPAVRDAFDKAKAEFVNAVATRLPHQPEDRVPEGESKCS